MAPAQTAVRALFTGGTFCYEAQLAFIARGLPCSSNAPAAGAAPFDGRFDGHVFLDLGDDDYTRGRPHPMIDPSLRDAAVRTQGADPQTAAILFDVVLGFGAHDNPAGGLAQALADAQREAHAHGRTLAMIGHVCGTDGDPQDKAAQVRQLEAAGAVVVDSNVEAAMVAAHLATQLAARRVRSGCVARRDWGSHPIPNPYATRRKARNTMSANSLFKESLTVVNVGLKGFGDDIVAAGGRCVPLEWQPPAQGDREGAWALAEILNHPVDRSGQRHGARAVPRCPPGADRRRGRARSAARHGRRATADRARGAADRLAADVRSDAGRRAGRGGARGLGRFHARPSACVAAAWRRARTLPPPGGGRADGGDHQPVDAGLRRREQGRGQSCVLQFQRRARQGAALRRQRAAA